MSDKTGLLVYLWFVPPLLQIVLPLLMLFVWLIAKLPRLIRFRKPVPHTITVVERRKYPRIAGELIGAVIADNSGKIIGKVKNISTSGICVSGFPKYTGKIHGEMTLRTGENNDFKLLVQPRWVQMKGTGKVFGASILNHPVGWPILARPAG